MDQNYQKITLRNQPQNTALYNKTLASCIIFDDGESLQQKYNNGTLIEDGILGGIRAVSPTVEVSENSDESYKLVIRDINGPVITPNLKGPKGPKGDTTTSDGTPIVSTHTYKYSFMSNDMEKITEDTYFLKIAREQHKLGFGAKVTEVFKYINDTEIISVLYAYKRLVNGDILMIFNVPFAGIIYLQGETNE